MTDSALLPNIDDTNEPFWLGCRAGVLRLQQCPVTRRLIFPPRPVNPWSPRDKAVWTDVCGRGTIWSVIAPYAPLMLDFTLLAPYNAIVVALEEDPTIRLIGNQGLDALFVELGLGLDVDRENAGLREIRRPHLQRPAIGDADFEDRDGLVLPGEEQPLVELGVVVTARSLVG